MSDYLSHLNEPQREAVKCIKGPVMIIAGAGSGKTRVLTYRIAYMIQQGVDPFNILSLTFTNKAAKEMKARIATVVGGEARNLWMGTFHSVFAKILRIEAEKIGYPQNFTIYDTDDSHSLIKDILKEQGLDDKIYKPSTVHNRISSAKNNLVSFQEYQQDFQIQNDDTAAGKPKMGLLYELYTKRCFKAAAMDFDDLLYKTYILLKNHPDVLHKYQHKFKYVMVDEFQDTNYAQYTILRKLAALNENICVVGDDAQSIYAFRGANIQNILNFEKDYKDLQVFKLEQNYRSTQNIVNAANSIIVHNKAQLKKSVWTENVEGERIRVIKALSDNEEGMQVAQAIFEDRQNKRFKNKDFAILYRTNAQSRSMEEALRKMNIPYRIFGGLSFYKRKEIKDILAYFRLCINFNDEEALKRIINYPVRGIGKTSLDKLIVLADSVDQSVWQVAAELDQYPGQLTGGAKSSIADFVTMIRSFAVTIRQKDAYEAALHIANSTGLLKDLYTDKSPEGVARYENIQALLNGIKEFVESGREATEITTDAEAIVQEGPLRTLDVYMQDIALLTDADKEDDKDDDKVSLMTIHAAKGLEFKEVFVVGLEENLFPSQLSINSREDLEEERRLFYVAVTRAEEKLSLSFANTRYRWGNLISSEPSRFLTEIDQQFLDLQTQRELSYTYNDEPRSWGEFGGETIKRPPAAKKPLATAPPKATPPASPGKNFKPISNAVPMGSAIANADFVADSTDNLQVGMEVEHQRFGKGKVLQIEGSLHDRKATIFFQGQGQKQLLLKFAKLKVLA